MYDEEDVIRDIETLFKAKLNDAIAEINTEKGATSGDVLFIDPIPTTNYVFETLDSRVLNYKGFFVMYGLVQVPIREAQLNSQIEDTTVSFQVATFDKGVKQRQNDLYKLLRYRRAIKKVIFDNPNMFRGFAKPLVQSLKPDAFPYDNKKVILSIGANIRASITGN